jgi:glycine cleavage system H protein
MRAGWLAKVKLSDPSEIESLLDEKAYQAHCEESDDH